MGIESWLRFWSLEDLRALERDLERMGVYGEEVEGVCPYSPGGRSRQYWKIQRKAGYRPRHIHVRAQELPQVLEQWKRTLFYRAIRREIQRRVQDNPLETVETGDVSCLYY